MICLDDKAVVPVGEPHCPISTNAPVFALNFFYDKPIGQVRLQNLVAQTKFY